MFFLTPAESNGYENSVYWQKWTVFSPVVKVKAIFGESVPGDAYYWQLGSKHDVDLIQRGEKRGKYAGENKMKKTKIYCEWMAKVSNSVIKNNPVNCSALGDVWAKATGESANKPLLKTESWGVLTLGRHWLFSLIGCLCTVIPEKDPWLKQLLLHSYCCTFDLLLK